MLVTDRDGNAFETQQYYAYGRPRGGGALPTDFTYTGQKVDGTGLMYYRARYYDPVIGQFISPDTLVPDAGSVLDYNRYLYVRGNPLNANDPSGHCPRPSSDTGSVICIAFFIPMERALNLKGDNRGFDYDSEPDESRAYLYVDLEKGASTKSIELHMNPSTGYFNGRSTSAHNVNEPGIVGYIKQAAGYGNWFEFSQQDDELVFKYSLNQSANHGPFVAPSIDGEIRLKPKLAMEIGCHLNPRSFPALEIYSYQAGELEQIIRQSEPRKTALVLNWMFSNETWNYPYDLPQESENSNVY
ncbi:MAG: RHS repeat-associated core domain-containing protein [Caldilineaceae bacterium]